MASRSPHPIGQKLSRPPPRRVCVFPYSVTDSRVVPPLFSESPCPSGTILLLRLNPATGGALTTETQPEEPEMAACRSSALTTSLSCQVRFRSSGSCSIGPLRRDRRLGSTLANQDAGWLSGVGGASLPAVSPQPLRREHGSVGVCGGLRLLCGVLAGRGFMLLLLGWARLRLSVLRCC